MKFGKHISAESANDWAPHYLAYGKLKKALKGKVGTPTPFAERLQREVGKVSAFVGQHAAGLRRRWAEPPAVAAAGPAVGQLYCDLQRLQAFVLVNCLAVVKITKKYNKRCPGEVPLDALAILRSCSFFQTPGDVVPSLGPCAPSSGLSLAGRDPALAALCCTAFLDLIVSNYSRRAVRPAGPHRAAVTDCCGREGPDCRAPNATSWRTQLLQDLHFTATLEAVHPDGPLNEDSASLAASPLLTCPAAPPIPTVAAAEPPSVAGPAGRSPPAGPAAGPPAEGR
eukprot:EG_transcript_22678